MPWRSYWYLPAPWGPEIKAQSALVLVLPATVPCKVSKYMKYSSFDHLCDWGLSHAPENFFEDVSSVLKLQGSPQAQQLEGIYLLLKGHHEHQSPLRSTGSM